MSSTLKSSSIVIPYTTSTILINTIMLCCRMLQYLKPLPYHTHNPSIISQQCHSILPSTNICVFLWLKICFAFPETIFPISHGNPSHDSDCVWGWWIGQLGFGYSASGSSTIGSAKWIVSTKSVAMHPFVERIMNTYDSFQCSWNHLIYYTDVRHCYLVSLEIVLFHDSASDPLWIISR